MLFRNLVVSLKTLVKALIKVSPQGSENIFEFGTFFLTSEVCLSLGALF